MKKHAFLAGFCIGYSWHASKWARKAVISGYREEQRRSATKATVEENRDRSTGEKSIVVQVGNKDMAEHIMGHIRYAIDEFGFFSRNDLRDVGALPPLKIGGDLGWDSPEDFRMAYREDQWVLIFTQPRRQESRG